MVTRRGRFIRQHTEKVSKSWVDLHCSSLTDRDIDILRTVLRCKIVIPAHIHALHFCGLSTHTCLHRLRKLFDCRCVLRLNVPATYGKGTVPQHLVLDKAGWIVLKQYAHAASIRYKPIIKLPSDYKHVIALSDLYCWILAQLDNEICVSITMDYQNAITFVSDKGPRTFIVDMLVTVKYAGSKKSIIAIERDMGTEQLTAISKKCQLLDEYRASGQWADQSWNDGLSRPVFPKIAWVFSSHRRLQWFETQQPSLQAKYLAACWEDLKHQSFTQSTWITRDGPAQLINYR